MVGPFDPPDETSPFDLLDETSPFDDSGTPGGSRPPPLGTSTESDPTGPPGGMAPGSNSTPPSAGPIPGSQASRNGMTPPVPGGEPGTPNGMSPSTPDWTAEMPDGMASGAVPQANASTLEALLSMPSSDEMEWAVPTYEVADPEGDHYALETRAESLSVLAYGDAVRRGKVNYLGTAKSGDFNDGVSGEEKADVGGLLQERIGRGLLLAAVKSETTVHGRMSINARGWKSNAFSGEDSILLGGALTDTWTGGLMIASAMSDDMVIGAGARVTAPVDMWLNQLTGMEERPGTAVADGVMVDLCGTLFEREVGPGLHSASMAAFSGMVHQTQRQGFWPMMRVAVGVRNMLPGAGGAASEPVPPSPPPAAAGGAGGALVATNIAGGVAGSVRSGDTLPDAIRAADAAQDLQEISNLRHADNTAVQLDELATAARFAEVEVPNGMGAADLPQASPPAGVAGADDVQIQGLELRAQHVGDVPDDGFQSPLTPGQLEQAGFLPEDFNLESALARIDHTIFGAHDGAVHGGGETLAGLIDTQSLMLDDIRTSLANKLDEMTDAGKQLDEFGELPSGLDKGPTPGTGIRPDVPWPRPIAEGEEARQLQLMAEVDALKSLESAIEAGEDPVTAIGRLTEEATSLYGPADPRTQAYVDMAEWFGEYNDVTKFDEKLAQLDIYMMVRAELLGGRDPRVAVQAILDSGEASAQTQAAAQTVLRNLNSPVFKLNPKVPQGLDTAGLQADWRALAENLRNAASSIDTSTPEGMERAAALNDAARALGMGALDMKRGRDPRVQMLDQIRLLESRIFTDGMEVGESTILRTAVAEYADLLGDFTTSTAALSSADDAGAATLVAGVGQLVGGTPIDPSPPYPGLADEFRPGEDLRLTIDPPGYSEVFPGGTPDEIRLLLDTQPEQLGGGVEDGVTVGGRLELNVATESTVAPIQPQMDEFGPRWVRVEEGDLAVPGTFERVIIVDESRVPVPDNYEVVRIAEDTGTQAAAVSSDTQAVVGSMAVRTAPEGADWHQTFEALTDDYMQYRRDSTWRVMAEYESGVEGLRDDLRRAITDFGGDSSQFTAQTPVSQLYDAVQELLGKAETAEDARRIQEFLDGFDVQTYDLYGDLAQRGDEFDGIRTGAAFPLDRHIDQDKLTEFLEQRFMDAMANADPSNQASRDEVAFYQQAHLAAKEGRNPLVDLGDQISYLRSKFDPNVPIEELPENLQMTALQAQNFQLHQQELMDLLSDPAFHKSAAAMGDDTYAPANFLRPGLGNPPAAGVGDVQTQIFDPEVVQTAQLGGGTDTVPGNYAANQEAINEHVGGNDFARVPEGQPAGLEPPAPASEQAPGARGILSTPDAGGGPVGLDDGRIVNRGPDGEIVSDEALELWAQRMLDESNDVARRNQGGYADYMDQMAELRTPQQRMEDDISRNRYAASRVEAANQLWDAQRGTDVRPPSEWERMPDTNGMRSWDQTGWRLPPTDRPRVRKSVRFGDAEVLMVAGDAEDVRKIRNQWRDLDNGNAAMPWWTGSGINRTTDPLNTDEAVRHVPAPRLATDRPSYPSSWRASRQPGFGRVADAPGAFPFNARERIIAELMQGKRIDASHIDLLQSTLNDAVRADRVQHREWLKMTALVRDLKYGTVFGDSRPFARAVDWKTLQIMLDMADSGSAIL